MDQQSRVWPTHDGLFYGGAWHEPKAGCYAETVDPATGDVLGRYAIASAEDIDAVVEEARTGYYVWRNVPAVERAAIMRKVAQKLRMHAEEIAHLDAANGGNPVTEMVRDVHGAAFWWDFYAGLVTEIKGGSIPFHANSLNFSVREPIGVAARIVAYNHPFMFTAGKLAAPLAAGNAVIVKPPEQAPLSGLFLAELISEDLPAGVVNVVTGGAEAGAALASHPGVGIVTLIGSVPTGRAILRSSSETIKPVILELGGKNPLIAFEDADPEKVADAAIAGMNFTWCGQSCGSTSRVFLHEEIHDQVVERIVAKVAHYKPGLPTDRDTTMGCLISQTQLEKVEQFVDAGIADGAQLVYGGHRPKGEALAKGFFFEPTVFTGVTQDMRIAREEIFGPVMSILRWTDEDAMIADVNRVPYGLTCSIWTNDLKRAHRTASAVEAGFVWINRVSTHFAGAPFGGYKQSGLGKENCLAELLAFTREKNIHIEFGV